MSRRNRRQGAAGLAVGPQEVVKQLRREFPGVEVTITSQDGLDASLTFAGEQRAEARARAAVLAHKASLFNAHLDLGHAGNRRNWWLRA